MQHAEALASSLNTSYYRLMLVNGGPTGCTMPRTKPALPPASGRCAHAVRRWQVDSPNNGIALGQYQPG